MSISMRPAIRRPAAGQSSAVAAMNALVDPSIYPLTSHALAPLIVGILAVLLGIAVVIRERASIASMAFCLLMAAAAVWLVSAAARRAGRADPQRDALVSATQLSSKNRSPSVRVARDRLALKVFPGSVALPLSPVG